MTLDAKDHLDYRALADFRFQVRRYLRKSEEASRAAGLEPQQHQLLLTAKALAVSGEPPSIKRIAERLHLRHHSVVGLVDRLETRSLVYRERQADDRRRVLVQLTPTGELVIEGLARFHREELRSLAPDVIAALQAVLSDDRSAARPDSVRTVGERLS